jgi:hypothetical protein
MTSPLARRHRFDTIGLKSPAKLVNSVAMPWVDMSEDVRLLREGFGERLPDDRWRVNGRTYVRESGPRGTMYPESGDGIVLLTRPQYKALAILRGYTADTVAAMNRLQNDPSISEDDIRVARDVIQQATMT